MGQVLADHELELTQTKDILQQRVFRSFKLYHDIDVCELNMTHTKEMTAGKGFQIIHA